MLDTRQRRVSWARLQLMTVAREADTFVEMARTYGLGFDELQAPPTRKWIRGCRAPGHGDRAAHALSCCPECAARRHRAEHRGQAAVLFSRRQSPAQPAVVETWPVGIGRAGWSTPTGDTTVVGKARDPIWYVPASRYARSTRPWATRCRSRYRPVPNNPLGNRVLQLGLPGYLIHGTNKPAGVGMRVSHGCMRLYPEDIEYLFDQVPDRDTPVRHREPAPATGTGCG